MVTTQPLFQRRAFIDECFQWLKNLSEAKAPIAVRSSHHSTHLRGISESLALINHLLLLN